MQSKFAIATVGTVVLISVLVTALQRELFDFSGIATLLSNLILVAYYLDRCERDDPQVNKCLMNSANKLARYLQKGVPELDIEQV